LSKQTLLQIDIEELSFETIIGILPFERTNKQRIVVNISFKYFYDSLKNNYIDYSEVTTLIKDICEKEKFELIEEALLFIEKKIRELYAIEELTLKISKPDILPDCKVGVSLSI